jgi:hypothetical protein
VLDFLLINEENLVMIDLNDKENENYIDVVKLNILKIVLILKIKKMK